MNETYKKHENKYRRKYLLKKSAKLSFYKLKLY